MADIRTTRSFDDAAAAELLAAVVTRVDTVTTWPAYALPPEPRIAGPSNIGDHLAGLGVDSIQATCHVALLSRMG